MCRDFCVNRGVKRTYTNPYSFRRAFTLANYWRTARTAEQAMDARIIAIVPQVLLPLDDTKVCRSDW